MSAGSVDFRARVEFLQQMQRLLTEGGFVATYKYALLHAIADLCVESEFESGQPVTLTVDRIAVKFIELYWRQVRPFPAPTSSPDSLLQQNAGRQATVINTLRTLNGKYEGRLSSLRSDPTEWSAAVHTVGHTIKKMPLWKLQTVGTRSVEFLYRNVPDADRIVLFPGVADSFRAFHGLIIELVRSGWARYIRRHNYVVRDSVELYGFLFGSERANLAAYRDALKEVDGSSCFYCNGSISRNPHVDHFISWARYPTDLGHNLVLAHSTCNEQKSDFLADEEHLMRWVERNASAGEQLSQAFNENRLEHDRAASMQIAEWAYGQVATVGGDVWVRGSEFTRLGDDWRRLLTCG